jgi:hypothetical protein
MTPPNREPGPDDMPLPDMPVPEQGLERLNLTGKMRCSLSHALTEEFMGVRPRDFMDISPQMIEAAQPSRLREHLLDVPRESLGNPCAIPYFDKNLKRDVHVALAPQEAKLVPYSVAGLAGSTGRRAAARAPASWLSSGERARERHLQAQAIEGKLPGMLQYKRMLEDNRDMLSFFVTASTGDNYGKLYAESEATMREKLSYLQTYVIDEGLVAAYAHQKDLPESKARLLSRTITHNLFISPKKTDYFHDMAKFLREYNGRKLDVVEQRINFVQRNIGKPLVARST